MNDVQIRTDGLPELIKRLGTAGKAFEEARRDALEAAAGKLKRAVDAEIGGTGKVRRWQDQIVGSGGGYVAIRPKARAWTEPNGRGKRYAVGHVTTAIECGHRFPTPSGRRYYKPRIKTSRQKVPGKGMYAKVSERLRAIAKEAAEEIEARLMDHLEGKA